MAEEITNSTETTETTQTDQTMEPETSDTADKDAEIARLKAELVKQKAATDKATSEAATTKKQLRAKQSEQERKEAEEAEEREKERAELAEYRKKFAVAEISKKVMAFVGDEEASTSIAEYLYGAVDADAALTDIQKAWTAREKALRLEYGKIPAPGVGATDGPAMTKEDILKIKDPALRQQKIAENINLFMKGS